MSPLGTNPNAYLLQFPTVKLHQLLSSPWTTQRLWYVKSHSTRVICPSSMYISESTHVCMCTCMNVCTHVCIYSVVCLEHVHIHVWYTQARGGCEAPLVCHSLLPSLKTLQLGWCLSRPSNPPASVPVQAHVAYLLSMWPLRIWTWVLMFYSTCPCP